MWLRPDSIFLFYLNLHGLDFIHEFIDSFFFVTFFLIRTIIVFIVSLFFFKEANILFPFIDLKEDATFVRT